MAYLRMHPGDEKWAGPWRTMETLINYFFILLGLYVLGAGTYVSSVVGLMFLYSCGFLGIDTIYYRLV